MGEGNPLSHTTPRAYRRQESPSACLIRSTVGHTEESCNSLLFCLSCPREWCDLLRTELTTLPPPV